MSDQSELDDGTGSPFLDGLSAFEAGVSKSTSVEVVAVSSNQLASSYQTVRLWPVGCEVTIV